MRDLRILTLRPRGRGRRSRGFRRCACPRARGAIPETTARAWSTACLAYALVSVLWAPRCLRVCPSLFLCLSPPPLPSLLWMWCTADLMSTTRRAFTTHSGWVCVTESGEEMWGKRVRHVEASLCGGGRRGRCSCALFAFAADFWTPAARCVAGWVRRLPSQSHTH